jgi:hypothetical protein
MKPTLGRQEARPRSFCALETRRVIDGIEQASTDDEAEPKHQPIRD